MKIEAKSQVFADSKLHRSQEPILCTHIKKMVESIGLKGGTGLYLYLYLYLYLCFQNWQSQLD